MIKVSFYESNAAIKGFTVKNHGRKAVCAAVSALTINCCNSLELLAKVPIAVTHDEKRGIIDLMLEGDEAVANGAAKLLLAAFELGINSVAAENDKDVSVSYKTV